MQPQPAPPVPAPSSPAPNTDIDATPALTPSSAPTPPPAAPADPQPQFIRELLRADVRSEFSWIDLDAATLDLLAEGKIAEAVRRLEGRAAAGDRTANVVLFELQDCSTIAADSAQQLQANEWRSVSRDLPAERRARIELALDARRRLAQASAKSCGEASFNRPLIAERLKAAAAAGDEASLRRLGGETTDAQARVKLWTSAAMLGSVPAQLDLVQYYRNEYLTAQRSGGRMKFWLDVAARTSSAGKLLMAECQLAGCNGQPPDPQAAAQLLRDAASEGDLEAIERLTASADDAGVNLEERAAWSDFRDRLNDAGCFGATEYPRVSIDSWRVREQNSSLSPYAQEQQRSLAEQYWREHEGRARRALGCS